VSPGRCISIDTCTYLHDHQKYITDNKLRKCEKPDSHAPLPPTPPPVLYRLFAANAILPDPVRTSATKRNLIVLHALSYLSRITSCACCIEQQDMLDFRGESIRMFSCVDPLLISKCVVEWAGAMRCAMEWVIEHPEKNYWSVHFYRKIVDSLLTPLQGKSYYAHRP
jgi:hypothetical protein